MNRLFRVEIRQSIAQLIDILNRVEQLRIVHNALQWTYACGFAFTEDLLFLHPPVEFAARCVFQEQEDALLIVKEPVETKNIRMSRTRSMRNNPREKWKDKFTSDDFEWRFHWSIVWRDEVWRFDLWWSPEKRRMFDRERDFDLLSRQRCICFSSLEHNRHVRNDLDPEVHRSRNHWSSTDA